VSIGDNAGDRSATCCGLHVEFWRHCAVARRLSIRPRLPKRTHTLHGVGEHGPGTAGEKTSRQRSTQGAPHPSWWEAARRRRPPPAPASKGEIGLARRPPSKNKDGDPAALKPIGVHTIPPARCQVRWLLRTGAVVTERSRGCELGQRRGREGRSSGHTHTHSPSAPADSESVRCQSHLLDCSHNRLEKCFGVWHTLRASAPPGRSTQAAIVKGQRRRAAACPPIHHPCPLTPPRGAINPLGHLIRCAGGVCTPPVEPDRCRSRRPPP